MRFNFDDPSGFDTRRRELFMLPVREYLQQDYVITACAQTGKQTAIAWVPSENFADAPHPLP